MSRIPLHITPEHPCSYLPEQQARTAFVSPDYQLTPFSTSRLAEAGFRRSGNVLYRPQCEGCTACESVRIPVAQFQPNRQQRRVWKKNADLDVYITDTIATDTNYALYEKYIQQRHFDGDMYPPTREQFESFLCVPWPQTFYIQFFLNEQLIAVATVDQYDNGLSAVYTFYDPEHEARSLGALAVLQQIELARGWNLPYLYLGFYVANCKKMNYKIQYQPLEHLQQGRWTVVTNQFEIKK